MNEKIKTIPYGKPVRVGNFKVWRSKFQISVMPKLDAEQEKQMVAAKGKVKKQKVDVDCINVSNLDGTWMVRIPATFEKYGILTTAYADYAGEDETLKKKAEAILATLFGNMMYVSAISNGYYQRAVEICAVAYANPDALGNGELLNDMKKLVEEYLDWRKEFDKTAKAQEPTAEEMKQDEIAEQAMEILSEETEGGTEHGE